jgi:hypothetical protein
LGFVSREEVAIGNCLHGNEEKANVNTRNPFWSSLLTCHLGPGDFEAFENARRRGRVEGRWLSTGTPEWLFVPSGGILPIILWTRESGHIRSLLFAEDIRRTLANQLREPIYRPGTSKVRGWSKIVFNDGTGRSMGASLPDLVLSKNFELCAQFFDKAQVLIEPQNEFHEIVAKLTRVTLPRRGSQPLVAVHGFSHVGEYMGFEVGTLKEVIVARSAAPPDLPISDQGLFLVDNRIDLAMPYRVLYLQSRLDCNRPGGTLSSIDNLRLTFQETFGHILPSLTTRDGIERFFADDANFSWE